MTDQVFEIFIDPKDGKPVSAGIKYRIYLNQLMLIERFFPNELPEHKVLLENVVLNLPKGEHVFRIESKLNLCIRKVAIDGAVMRPMDTEFSVTVE